MPAKRQIRTWPHNPTSNAPVSYRKACKYEVYFPEPLTALRLQLDIETMSAISEAEHAIMALNEIPQPALKPFARLLLRTESIASSKVEGMQMGVRELARAEARRDSGAKTGSAALEILANIDAMELAVEEAASVEVFSISEIESIHRLLMEEAWNAHVAGKIRTRQNWIGGNDYNPCGADFVPPPPEEVQPLLIDLCNAINDDMLPPIVQAAIVHAQFETIHPFDDGNGRTGRALIQIVLRRRKVAAAYVPPISVILAKSKERYISGLTSFREDGGGPRWIKQFSEAAASSAYLARSYLTAVTVLVEKWRSMLRSAANPRRDSVAWRIIDLLPAHPIITGPIAKAVTGVATSQVSKAMIELQNAGVLTPVSAGTRNRSWEAVGLLEIIGRLEAGDLPIGSTEESMPAPPHRRLLSR